MNKYFGIIGYMTTEEDPEYPSVYVPVLKEHAYFGDVIKDTRRRETNDAINDHLKLAVRISIIADENIIQNASEIKYATYLGNKWCVTEIESAHPRLILTLGEIYTGESEVRQKDAQ